MKRVSNRFLRSVFVFVLFFAVMIPTALIFAYGTIYSNQIAAEQSLPNENNFLDGSFYFDQIDQLHSADVASLIEQLARLEQNSTQAANELAPIIQNLATSMINQHVIGAPIQEGINLVGNQIFGHLINVIPGITGNFGSQTVVDLVAGVLQPHLASLITNNLMTGNGSFNVEAIIGNVADSIIDEIIYLVPSITPAMGGISLHNLVIDVLTPFMQYVLNNHVRGIDVEGLLQSVLNQVLVVVNREVPNLLGALADVDVMDFVQAQVTEVLRGQLESVRGNHDLEGVINDQLVPQLMGMLEPMMSTMLPASLANGTVASFIFTQLGVTDANLLSILPNDIDGWDLVDLLNYILVQEGGVAFVDAYYDAILNVGGLAAMIFSNGRRHIVYQAIINSFIYEASENFVDEFIINHPNSHALHNDTINEINNLRSNRTVMSLNSAIQIYNRALMNRNAGQWPNTIGELFVILTPHLEMAGLDVSDLLSSNSPLVVAEEIAFEFGELLFSDTSLSLGNNHFSIADMRDQMITPRINNMLTQVISTLENHPSWINLFGNTAMPRILVDQLLPVMQPILFDSIAHNFLDNPTMPIAGAMFEAVEQVITLDTLIELLFVEVIDPERAADGLVTIGNILQNRITNPLSRFSLQNLVQAMGIPNIFADDVRRGMVESMLYRFIDAIMYADSFNEAVDYFIGIVINDQTGYTSPDVLGNVVAWIFDEVSRVSEGNLTISDLLRGDFDGVEHVINRIRTLLNASSIPSTIRNMINPVLDNVIDMVDDIDLMEIIEGLIPTISQQLGFRIYSPRLVMPFVQLILEGLADSLEAGDETVSDFVINFINQVVTIDFVVDYIAEFNAEIIHRLQSPTSRFNIEAIFGLLGLERIYTPSRARFIDPLVIRTIAAIGEHGDINAAFDHIVGLVVDHPQLAQDIVTMMFNEMWALQYIPGFNVWLTADSISTTLIDTLSGLANRVLTLVGVDLDVSRLVTIFVERVLPASLMDASVADVVTDIAIAMLDDAGIFDRLPGNVAMRNFVEGQVADVVAVLLAEVARAYSLADNGASANEDITVTLRRVLEQFITVNFITNLIIDFNDDIIYRLTNPISVFSIYNIAQSLGFGGFTQGSERLALVEQLAVRFVSAVAGYAVTANGEKVQMIGAPTGINAAWNYTMNLVVTHPQLAQRIIIWAIGEMRDVAGITLAQIVGGTLTEGQLTNAITRVENTLNRRFDGLNLAINIDFEGMIAPLFDILRGKASNVVGLVNSIDVLGMFADQINAIIDEVITANHFTGRRHLVDLVAELAFNSTVATINTPGTTVNDVIIHALNSIILSEMIFDFINEYHATIVWMINHHPELSVDAIMAVLENLTGIRIPVMFTDAVRRALLSFVNDIGLDNEIFGATNLNEAWDGAWTRFIYGGYIAGIAQRTAEVAVDLFVAEVSPIVETIYEQNPLMAYLALEVLFASGLFTPFDIQMLGHIRIAIQRLASMPVSEVIAIVLEIASATPELNRLHAVLANMANLSVDVDGYDVSVSLYGNVIATTDLATVVGTIARVEGFSLEITYFAQNTANGTVTVAFDVLDVLANPLSFRLVFGVDTDEIDHVIGLIADLNLLTLTHTNVETYAGYVSAARSAYGLLSVAQQTLVDTTDLAVIEQLVVDLRADNAAAQIVIDQITALVELTHVNVAANVLLVQAARSAFNGLTEVRQGLVANLNVLEAREAAVSTLTADNAAAQIVIDQITALVELTHANVAENVLLVQAARSAFNGLTGARPGLVTNLYVLEAAEGQVIDLKADNAAAQTVIDQIATLVELNHANVAENVLLVQAARSAFNGLTEVRQGLVDNLNVLEAREASVSTLTANNVAAQIVTDQIAALVELNHANVSANVSYVQAARSAFNGLTETRQDLVGNLDVLEAREASVSVLTADNAAAQLVIDLIVALPTVFTVATHAANSTQVGNARVAFNLLSEVQKSLVGAQLDADLAAAEALVAHVEAIAYEIHIDNQPTLANHSFAGWVVVGTDVAFTNDTPITITMVLEATFAIHTFAVSISGNGITVSPNVTVANFGTELRVFRATGIPAAHTVFITVNGGELILVPAVGYVTVTVAAITNIVGSIDSRYVHETNIIGVNEGASVTTGLIANSGIRNVFVDSLSNRMNVENLYVEFRQVNPVTNAPIGTWICENDVDLTEGTWEVRARFTGCDVYQAFETTSVIFTVAQGGHMQGWLIAIIVIASVIVGALAVLIPIKIVRVKKSNA